MKKAIYSILICGLILCSGALLAETGVIVHLKSGEDVFYPASELENVEFTEDYSDDVNNGEIDNPGEQPENPGETEQPEGPSGEDPSEPSQPEQPEEPSQPETPVDPEPENPSTPEEPETPSESEKPDTPAEPETPTEPENPIQPEPQPEQPAETVKAFSLYKGNEIALNQTYLIVAQNRCATPIDLSKDYGYQPSTEVSINQYNIISGNTDNGFYFTSTVQVNGATYNAPSGKFLIRDHNNRYLKLTESYKNFNYDSNIELSASQIPENYLFTATKNSDNTWKIVNNKNNDTRYVVFDSQYNTFAAYNTVSNNNYYPSLYIYGDVPSSEAGNGSGNHSSSGSTTTTPVPSDYEYPLSYVVLPEGTPQQVKEYTGFTLNFNKDNHTPNFVAWELLASETNGNVATNRNYWVDKEIEGCLSTDFAYNTYNYERGHMCPAADQKWSSQAMKDAAVMTNMSPMPSDLNSKIWSTLENKEREWAKKYGSIWIVCGPIYYDNDTLYIGKAQARVPSAYFKAFLYYNGNNSKAIAFIFKNGLNTGDLSGYAMSIDELEKQTGYDFFSALPDDIENAVEANYNFSAW